MANRKIATNTELLLLLDAREATQSLRDDICCLDPHDFRDGWMLGAALGSRPNRSAAQADFL